MHDPDADTRQLVPDTRAADDQRGFPQRPEVLLDVKSRRRSGRHDLIFDAGHAQAREFRDVIGAGLRRVVCQKIESGGVGGTARSEPRHRVRRALHRIRATIQHAIEIEDIDAR